MIDDCGCGDPSHETRVSRQSPDTPTEPSIDAESTEPTLDGDLNLRAENILRIPTIKSSEAAEDLLEVGVSGEVPDEVITDAVTGTIGKNADVAAVEPVVEEGPVNPARETHVAVPAAIDMNVVGAFGIRRRGPCKDACCGPSAAK